MLRLIKLGNPTVVCRSTNAFSRLLWRMLFSVGSKNVFEEIDVFVGVL